VYIRRLRYPARVPLSIWGLSLFDPFAPHLSVVRMPFPQPPRYTESWCCAGHGDVHQKRVCFGLAAACSDAASASCTSSKSRHGASPVKMQPAAYSMSHATLGMTSLILAICCYILRFQALSDITAYFLDYHFITLRTSKTPVRYFIQGPQLRPTEPLRH
jgi:hypothetical protein